LVKLHTTSVYKPLVA